jgi:group I intron endonuclease
MDTLNPEYNICTTAGSTLGKLHSEGTKAKLREAGIGRIHSEETKAKMAEAGIGRKHTEETKTKISDAQTGYKHPDEIKKRISEAKKGKPKIEGSGRPAQSIEVFDNKNNSTTIYDSIRAAARALDIKQSRISTYFARNQQKPYKGRYIFRDTESKL